MIILRQFLQYLLGGGIGFAVDLATLYLCTEMLGLHYLLSATVAFLLGLAVNYLVCVTWVFRVRTVEHRGHEFAIFSIIGIFGLALNNALMYALTDTAGFHYMGSKLLATGAVLMFNFFLRRTMLFTERQAKVPQ